jgi:hypothetical protein
LILSARNIFKFEFETSWRVGDETLGCALNEYSARALLKKKISPHHLVVELGATTTTEPFVKRLG